MLGLLALARKRMSPNDQLEISASNVCQNRIVHAPKFLKIQLNRLVLRSEASLYNRPRVLCKERIGWSENLDERKRSTEEGPALI